MTKDQSDDKSPHNNWKSTRRNMRKQLECEKDAFKIGCMSFEEASDFYGGGKAGIGSGDAEECRTIHPMLKRTEADALKEVRRLLRFAIHQNYHMRAAQIRKGQLRVLEEAQLRALNERIRNGEIDEKQLASMPSYISDKEWDEDKKIADLIYQEFGAIRFSPEEERIVKERLEVLLLLLSRPISWTAMQLPG